MKRREFLTLIGGAAARRRGGRVAARGAGAAADAGDLRSTDLKLGQQVAAESHRSPVAHIKSVWSQPQSQPR